MHTPSFALVAHLNCPLSHPHSSCLPCRLVHSGPGKSSPLLDSDLSFGLRSGTKQGVETHVFRVDSAKELSTWTHLLVEGCHNAAELIKEVTTGTDPEICLTPSSAFYFSLHSFLHLQGENSILKRNQTIRGHKELARTDIWLSLSVACPRLSRESHNQDSRFDSHWGHPLYKIQNRIRNKGTLLCKH